MQFFSIGPDDLVKEVQRLLPGLRRNMPEELGAVERWAGNSDLFVPYYISPNAQNINPADVPEDNTGLVALSPALSLLDHYLGSANRFTHAFILADAGMGKTSLLVLIYLAYLSKLIQSTLTVRLFKLGADTDAALAEISDPHNTVVLLDALDEDPAAWDNFYARLQNLLHTTKSFRKVLITCRTQFFPTEHEKDGPVPGLVSLHGFQCSKLFLSPFNDGQVEQYLRCRFSDPVQFQRALTLALNMRSLKFRPMLLSYIEYLMSNDTHFASSFDLYESLVDGWFARELTKGVIPDDQPLRDACSRIAWELYTSRKRVLDRAGISELCDDVDGLAALDRMAVEGRSLLHRTNELPDEDISSTRTGGYKFAHYSILEFFVAQRLAATPAPIRNTDQVKLFLCDLITFHNLRDIRCLDLSQSRIKNGSCRSLNAHDADLIGTIFEDTDLSRAVFSGAKLDAATMGNCTLHGANFKGVNATGLSFISCRLNSAHCDDVSVRDAAILSCTLHSIATTGLALTNGVVRDCEANESQWNKLTLNAVELHGFRSTAIRVAELSSAHCKYGGIDFTSGQLSSCHIDHANIRSISLQLCHQHSVAVRNTTITDAILQDGRLSECTFDATMCSGVRITKCTIDHLTWIAGEIRSLNATLLNLSAAKLVRASFVDVKLLSRIDMKDIELVTCSGDIQVQDAALTRATLAGGELSLALSGGSCTDLTANGTTFLNCSVNASRLGNVIFTGCLIRDSRIRDTECTDLIFRECRFIDLVFQELQLHTTRFDRCQFERVQFIATTLPSLNGFTLRHCSFNGVEFRESNCEDARFIKCDLTGADLTLATCLGAQFDGSSLRNAKLTGCMLRRASFAQVDLRGADLTGAVLDDAIWRDAIVNDETKLARPWPKGVIHERDFGTKQQ